MKASYKACLSRSLHSVFARIRCVRWVNHVVEREAPAPTNEPSVAAIAATIAESIFHPCCLSCRPSGQHEALGSSRELGQRFVLRRVDRKCVAQPGDLEFG